MPEAIIIEIIKWTAGIMSGSIVVAVSIIAWFWRRDRLGIDKRFEKGDKKFDEIQRDIKQHQEKNDKKFEKTQEDIQKINMQIAETIPVMKRNVENNAKIIDMIKQKRK